MSGRQARNWTADGSEEFVDRSERCEPAFEDSAWATEDWNDGGETLERPAPFSTETPLAAAEWSDEIELDEGDRSVFAATHRRSRGFGALAIFMLLIASGLWFGGSDWYGVFLPDTPSTARPGSDFEASAPREETVKEDPSGDVAARAIPQLEQDTPQTLKEPEVSPAPADASAGPSSAERQPQPSDAVSPAENATSTIDAEDVQIPQKPTDTVAAVAKERPEEPIRHPVPETKPTTIEGWTVLEVVGETIVLEGPNGVWRVKRGDSVPGVGNVDSIVYWGSHLLVVTQKGLIAKR